MEQIFNELSASSCYDSRHNASAGIQRLLNLSRNLSQIGFSRYLRTIEDFSQLFLAPGYTVHEWATDREVGADRDLQRWLLTYATKAPYIDQFIDEAERGGLVEFRFEKQRCKGLGLAYLWGIGALSLDGDDRFTVSPISLQFYQIDDNKESEYVVNVESFYSSDQLQKLRGKAERDNINGITTGDSLLSKCDHIFPYLSIGDKAAKQLSLLTGSEIYFQEIIRHFSVLNQNMLEWTRGPFAPKGITWSTESSSTMNRFCDQRTFLCKDGVSRVFSLHSKLLSANQRIHFYPDVENRMVYVGYVGKHLQTIKHRT